MELQDFFLLLKRKSQTIFIIVVAAILLTLSISLLMPLRYEAQSKLLITQNSANTDAYALSRSNEYLGNLFAQVIQSSSFLELTLASNYNINQDYFKLDNAKKMQTWQRVVQAKTYSDSGIIEISIYHENPYQAQQIALAVNDVLLNKNQNYHGGGDKIKINIIDQPLISKYPVKPNLISNTIMALVLSFIFSLFYVYLLPNKKYDLHIFKSKKKKKLEYQKEIAQAAIWNKLPTEQVNPTINDREKTNQVEQPVNKNFNGNINNILR
jgi:capsular polysaccharide biosynthesis protein